MTIYRAQTLDNLPEILAIRDAIVGRRIQTVRYMVILDSDSWRDAETDGNVHQIEAVILGLTGGITMWCSWGTPLPEGMLMMLGAPPEWTFDIVDPEDQHGWKTRLWKKVVDLRVAWEPTSDPHDSQALWATTFVLDGAEPVAFALGSWHVSDQSLFYDPTSLAVLFGKSVATAYRPDGSESAWGESLSG